MDPDALIGCGLGAGALGLMTYLVWWSRRTIDRIARSGFRSVRRIMKELHGDG